MPEPILWIVGEVMMMSEALEHTIKTFIELFVVDTRLREVKCDDN